MRKSKVLRKLRNGERALAVGVTLCPSPKVAEIAGLVGFDCAWVDMEHRELDYKDVFHISAASRGADIDTMVRIRKEGPESYFRPLECGAEGIMVPHVSSPAEARECAEQARFHPIGHRGMDPAGPDCDYGLIGLAEYIQHANRETFIAVEIEDQEAVQSVDEIAAVPGVDILFLGLLDLSQAYGIPGEMADGRVQRAIEKVAEAAARSGKWWGLPVGTPAAAKDLAAMGASFFVCGSDRRFIVDGFRKTLDEYRAAL